MVLAAVTVMLLVTWMGINVMASFVAGNERQATVDASTEIYKRARLVSLGYNGSSERVSVSIPNGYAVLVNDSIVAVGGVVNGSLVNSMRLTVPMSVQGVDLVGGDSDAIGNGTHDVSLVYLAEDGKVVVSW
jgi:hypothetical protein